MSNYLPCDDFDDFGELSYQSKKLINDRISYCIPDSNSTYLWDSFVELKSYFEAILDVELSPIWRSEIDHDVFNKTVESLIINSCGFIKESHKKSVSEAG